MLKKMKGSIMILAAAVIWGSAFVAQSEGAEHIGTFTYNSARSFAGGIFLLILILLISFAKGKNRTGEVKDIRKSLKGGTVCGVFLFAGSAFQQAGIAQTSAGKAGFITALYIILVPAAGIFFGRRVSLRIWICAAAALAGFYLLCIKKDMSIGKGDLLVLVCALFFTGHIIAVDHFAAGNTDGILMSCVQFFTAGIISVPFMFIMESPDVSSICAAAVPILYAGILSSGVAYTLQIAGQKHTPPAAATLIMSLESVFAALSGWLILNEKMTVKELSGCIVVFAAVIISQLPEKENINNCDK